MRALTQVLSAIALVGIVTVPCLCYAGALSFSQLKVWIMVSTALWFVTTPFWMERRPRA